MDGLALAEFCVEEGYAHVNGDVGFLPRMFSCRGITDKGVDALVDAVVDGILEVSNPPDPAWYFDLHGRRKYHVFSPYPFEDRRRSTIEQECVSAGLSVGLLLRAAGSYRWGGHRSHYSREGLYLLRNKGCAGDEKGAVSGILVDFLESKWGLPHFEEVHLVLLGMTCDVLRYGRLSSWSGLEEKQVVIAEAKPL